MYSNQQCGLSTSFACYCNTWIHGRYLENVPAIVPLLEKEYRNAAARLESTQEELNDLHPDK